ncbi:uncharacterized protein LOC128556993 isoform X2 [Mercenaria mercenaria]|uniref:uncharacterized protein LOC128556993 isoform X2 n=1 Tax=Mercenaria mercenaria TaxID=6596 RepID=UPI00234F204F|nr:uncharacterized protein LOC128556993 isoform X2 [Mercenaria mercenaria]
MAEEKTSQLKMYFPEIETDTFSDDGSYVSVRGEDSDTSSFASVTGDEEEESANDTESVSSENSVDLSTGTGNRKVYYRNQFDDLEPVQISKVSRDSNSPDESCVFENQTNSGELLNSEEQCKTQLNRLHVAPQLDTSGSDQQNCMEQFRAEIDQLKGTVSFLCEKVHSYEMDHQHL